MISLEGKKLAICGDSWMSPTLEEPGTHFSELLAKSYRCELLSLARGGCSNAAICLQIEQAISMGVDFMIIGSTYPDRMEIPINNNIQITNTKSMKIPETWKEFLDIFKLNVQKYEKQRGLANISYARHPDLSANNDFMQDPVLISETIKNLIYSKEKINSFYKLNPIVIESLKSFIANLYDSNFKRQIDCWIMNNMLRKLKYETKIQFLFFPHLLFVEEYGNDIKWLDNKNIADTIGPYSLEKSDTRYHTTIQAQIYTANELAIKINDILNH